MFLLSQAYCVGDMIECGARAGNVPWFGVALMLYTGSDSRCKSVRIFGAVMII